MIQRVCPRQVVLAVLGEVDQGDAAEGARVQAAPTRAAGLDEMGNPAPRLEVAALLLAPEVAVLAPVNPIPDGAVPAVVPPQTGQRTLVAEALIPVYVKGAVGGFSGAVEGLLVVEVLPRGVTLRTTRRPIRVEEPVLWPAGVGAGQTAFAKVRPAPLLLPRSEVTVARPTANEAVPGRRVAPPRPYSAEFVEQWAESAGLYALQRHRVQRLFMSLIGSLPDCGQFDRL